MDKKYEKILHLPHYRSPNRPAMARGDRAAQFAPFSALSGHAEGAEETARVTQMRRELSEDEIALLDEKLGILQAILQAVLQKNLNQNLDLNLDENFGEYPQISATYFMADARKEGGAYLTIEGRVKRIHRNDQLILLADGRQIPVGDLMALEIL